MKFLDAPTLQRMTPWQIMEEALARKKPPRKVQWLADELGVTAQVMANWKMRGKVPPSRFREVAVALGLTVDQLEGYAPLPWADDQSWPFQRVSIEAVTRLRPEQRMEIEDELIRAIAKFDRIGGAPKLSAAESEKLAQQTILPPRRSKRSVRKSA